MHLHPRSTQTTLGNSDGHEIGLDSIGKKLNQSRWRWFGIFTEGGEYENASLEDAVLLNRILDSACLMPYPKH